MIAETLTAIPDDPSKLPEMKFDMMVAKPKMKVILSNTPSFPLIANKMFPVPMDATSTHPNEIIEVSRTILASNRGSVEVIRSDVLTATMAAKMVISKLIRAAFVTNDCCGW